MINLFLVDKATAYAELQRLLNLDIANLTKPELKTNVEELKNALEGIAVHSTTNNFHGQQRGA